MKKQFQIVVSNFLKNKMPKKNIYYTKKIIIIELINN